MKLIKERWYELSSGKCRLHKNWFIKFRGTDASGIIRSSEYINGNGSHIVKDGNFGVVGTYAFTECPLSEIQQYLPKGHPDKEFALPEKWCVRDCEEVSKWASKVFGCGCSVNSSKYLCVKVEKFPNFDSYCFHSKESASNYTEITFEQFKKHFLKQEDMDKEIIGYKLKEDCKQYEEVAPIIMNANWGEPKYHVTSSRCIKDLRKAGVLGLWFEPICREELKVGDWVTWGNSTTGRIVKHCKSFADSWSLDVKGDTEQYNSCSESNLRLATPEEIKKTLVEEAVKRGFKGGVKIKTCFPDYSPVYTSDRSYKMNDYLPEYEQYLDALRMGGSIIYHRGKWAEILPNYPQIEINGYKGEFFDWGVKFGCAEISKEVFIDLAKCREHKNTNRDIESATIGKGTFSKDQIKQIAEYYLDKK